MKKYLVGLNQPVNDEIRNKLEENKVHIYYEPDLLDDLVFVESNLSKEEIEAFDFVEKVELERTYTTNI